MPGGQWGERDGRLGAEAEGHEWEGDQACGLNSLLEAEPWSLPESEGVLATIKLAPYGVTSIVRSPGSFVFGLLAGVSGRQALARPGGRQ